MTKNPPTHLAVIVYIAGMLLYFCLVMGIIIEMTAKPDALTKVEALFLIPAILITMRILDPTRKRG